MKQQELFSFHKFYQTSFLLAKNVSNFGRLTILPFPLSSEPLNKNKKNLQN